MGDRSDDPPKDEGADDDRNAKPEEQQAPANIQASQPANQGGDADNNGGGDNNNMAADERDECAFCLDAIDSDDALIPTKCPHITHKICMLRWLKTTRSCPICRKRIRHVKMKKTGEKIPLPKLDKPVPGSHMYEEPPRLNDMEFINAELTTTDEDDSDFEVTGSGPPSSPSHRAIKAHSHSHQSESPSSPNSIQRRRRLSLPGPSRRSGRRLGQGKTDLRAGQSRRNRGRIQKENKASIINLRAPSPLVVPSAPVLNRRARARPRRVSSSPPLSTTRGTRARQRIGPSAERTLNRIINEMDEQISAFLSDDDDEEEEGEENESSSEDSNTGSDEGSGDSTSEEDSDELDESVLDDQPSTSRQMVPIVRKTRGAKKKGTKKKTSTKKTSTKKKTTKKRKTTKRGKKRTRVSVEEARENRHRVQQVMPSLSLNGAGLEPISDDNAEEPPVKRERVCVPLPSASASSIDPTDLLGSILDEQVVAHAPGRYLEQRDGRLVPGEKFDRHLDRLEKRGVQVTRPKPTPASASTTPAVAPAPIRSVVPASRPSADSAPRQVPLETRTTRLPPPPPPPSQSSSNSLSAKLRKAKIETQSGRSTGGSGSSSRSRIPPLILSSTSAGTSSQSDSSITVLTLGSDGVFHPYTPSNPHARMPSSSTAGTDQRNGTQADDVEDKSASPALPSNGHANHSSSKSKKDRHSSSTSNGVGPKTEQKFLFARKRETLREMHERHNRERFHTIRQIASQITDEEVTAGRITTQEQNQLALRVTSHLLQESYVEEKQVIERTRIELGHLLEKKMFS